MPEQQPEPQPATDGNKQRQAKCVWVLAASPEVTHVTDFDRLPRPDAVIAADGGSTLAHHLGLAPDLIVGDMDSSDPALLAQFAGADVPFERHDHNTKWETDTELAVLAALAWHPDTVVLLGALGGRLDHSLANILLLTHPALADVDFRIWDGEQETWLAKPGKWNPVEGKRDDLVTLLPIGVEASGVSTRGLLYPLSSEPLTPGRGRGVSNRIAEGDAAVWLDKGLLMVVVVHLS